MNRVLCTPTVPGLVKPEMHLVEVHVDEVRAAGAIQVREKHPPGVEVAAYTESTRIDRRLPQRPYPRFGQ
jgi:hypothetical protein